MFRRLRPRSVYDVFAVLALIVAVGGTSAYAANTVFSTDIVDGEVKSVDIGNNEIGSADVKDNSINTFDVHSFLGADVADGTLTGADVGDESLTGADILESSLGQVPSAADSDKLDGVDSTGFVRGSGSTKRWYFTGFNGGVSHAVPLGHFFLRCLDGTGAMEQYQNLSGGPMSLWTQRASTGQVTFQTVANNGAPVLLNSNITTERITVHVSTGTKSETFDAWIVADGTACTINLIETSD